MKTTLLPDTPFPKISVARYAIQMGGVLVLFLILTVFCCGAVTVVGQGLPPAPPGASYYEYSDGTSTIYELLPDSPEGLGASSGGGRFSADDSPPSPGGSPESGGAPTSPYIPPQIPGTNLWLIIQQQSNSAIVTISNTVAGFRYILLSTTNLADGPWVENQSLTATNTTALCQPIALDGEAMFFEALQGVPGTLRWAAAFGVGLEATPSLSPDQSTIYQSYIAQIGIGTNMVSALNFLTGSAKWTQPIYNGAIFDATNEPQPAEFTGSPAVSPDGTEIVVGSKDGNVYCLNPDGMTNWVAPTGTFVAVCGTPALWSNRVYAATDETLVSRTLVGPDGLTCLAINGSETNFFFQPQDLFYGQGGDVDNSPAVDNSGNAYFLGESHRLYCVAPTGDVCWYLPLPGDTEPDSSAALGSDGTIYVGSGSDFVYAVNPDGSIRWVFDTLGDGTVQGSPIIGPDNTVYITAGDTLFALTNGTPAWEFSDPGCFLAFSAAVAQDGTVYVGDFCGNFFAVTNGVAEWSTVLGNSIVGGPMIAQDGTVLVPCFDGNLYAIWGSAPLAANAPWPCFHHDAQLSGVQTQYAPAVQEGTPPFLSNATNDGMGNFTFSIVGLSNTSWSVYASTNLSNWVELTNNLLLTAIGTTNDTGTNMFIDPGVSGLSQRFYMLTNSGVRSEIIGFVNLTVDPGTNLIADQFQQVDDFVLHNSSQEAPMNTLNALFYWFDPWGANQAGTEVLEWNGSGLEEDAFIPGFVPPWIEGGNMTLLPGMGAYMVNTTTNPFPISFVGLVRERQVFQITNQINFLSPTAPLAGNITNVTGYRPYPGDTIELWDTNTSNYVSHTFASGAWSNGVPILALGQGFKLITTHIETWTNTLPLGGGP